MIYKVNSKVHGEQNTAILNTGRSRIANFSFALVFNMFLHDITVMWTVGILFIMRFCSHLKIFCWCLRVLFSFFLWSADYST